MSEGIALRALQLGAYVPGNGPTLYPQDTGVLLRKDQSIAFQMHYTTSGKPAHDVTRFGLYFHKEPPQVRVQDGGAREPEDFDSGQHEGAHGVDRQPVPAGCAASTD